MPSWRERLALALVPKSRALTINDAIRGQWAGIQTATGLRVDEKASLQIISVFTAVKILSSGFAQVPLKVYRSSPDGSRAEVREHPMYNLLHFRPNERMTAFGMREHWMMSLALWGNSYTQIIRNNRGDVESLWPLNPGAVKPERKPDGSIIYRVKLNADPFGFVSSGVDEVLREEEVLHIRGFTLDGLKGLSPIEMIRENVALSSAYQEFAARFFGNGGIPGFVLSTDRPMQEPTVESIRKEWNENYQGLRNAQKVAILHSGTKVEKIGIPPEDMQFLESRQFEREEIFSFYRIPPNFYSANRITSWGSGIKEMSIGFVKFTLDPEFVRVEDALDSKFFGSPAQGPLFPEFDREGFLRGDFQTRIQGYKDLWGMGVVSNRWIARTENLPEPPTEVFAVPSNVTPIDKIDAIAEQQAAPPPAPVAAPAAPAAASEAALNVQGHQTRTDLGKFVRSYMETFKHRQDTDPQSIDREIVRAGNAFLYAAYRATGATELVWVAGDDCEKCRELDGKTRTFEDKHPPLCDECRCAVIAIKSETRTEGDGPLFGITINQSPVTVESPPPADIKIEQAAQEPPTVNIENKVEVPAQAAPVVNIEQAAQEPPIINLPKAETQQPPVVNVTVSPTPVTVRNEVKTPEVHIDNKVETAPAGDITLEYDEQKGRLKSLKRKKS